MANRCGISLMLGLATVLAWQAVRPTKDRPYIPVAGPKQNKTTKSPIKMGTWRITPLADYELNARVIKVQQETGGGLAKLAPTDILVAWGPMAQPKIINEFTWTMDGRTSYIAAKNKPTVQRSTVIWNTATVHLIPANQTIRTALEQIKPQDIVNMTGQLVKVSGPDGFTWASSLNQGNVGDGACKLYRVTGMELH